MRDLITKFQIIFTTIGAFLGWFLGSFDGFLYTLIAFIVVDYITGVFCAIVDKRLSSEIGFRGIFKKVLILALVGVAHTLDTRILVRVGDNLSILRTMVIFFYLSNEGISILENASHLGLPIPDKLKSVLKQLQSKNKDEPPST